MKMPSNDEQDHALRGAEVPAVHAGEEDADPQLEPAVLDDAAAPLGDQPAEPRLQDDEDHGDDDQDRHHVVEHRARQREQQHAAGDPADERRQPEHGGAVPLAAELAPVADRPAEAAEGDPTVLLTLATTGENPMASRVGKVISEPEPTIVLMVPARKAAPISSRASRTDMTHGTVDCIRS